MAASWPIQFTKGSRPGVKRCQQSTEEDTTPKKKKDRSQYENKQCLQKMMIIWILMNRILNMNSRKR